MQEHIAYYRRLIAEDPRNIDAHLRLGAIWRQEGQVGEAVRAYNSAARLLSEGGLELEAIAACRGVPLARDERGLLLHLGEYMVFRDRPKLWPDFFMKILDFG